MLTVAEIQQLPPNMRLMFLPPYSPELNPAEHLWEAIREDCFANHILANLDAIKAALTDGIASLEAAPSRTRSMTGFRQTASIFLNAIQYQCATRAMQ